jgi:hypothetical protein
VTYNSKVTLGTYELKRLVAAEKYGKFAEFRVRILDTDFKKTLK